MIIKFMNSIHYRIIYINNLKKKQKARKWQVKMKQDKLYWEN